MVITIVIVDMLVFIVSQNAVPPDTSPCVDSHHAWDLVDHFTLHFHATYYTYNVSTFMYHTLFFFIMFYDN